MTATALLVAMALALALSDPPVSRRLPSPRMTIEVAAPTRPPMAVPALPLCAVGGFALAVGIGGPAGLALGGTLALFGPWLLARLRARDAAPAPNDEALPLALDLLAACLAGGSSPAAAVAAVAAATDGVIGERLAHVATSLALGLPPAQAFEALGDEGPAGAVARTLRRALDGGTPVADAVARVAEEARQAGLMASQARAKRLAVTSIAPLVVCFLPAFFLIGVVPALYSAFVDLFGQIS